MRAHLPFTCTGRLGLESIWYLYSSVPLAGARVSVVFLVHQGILEMLTLCAILLTALCALLSIIDTSRRPAYTFADWQSASDRTPRNRRLSSARCPSLAVAAGFTGKHVTRCSKTCAPIRPSSSTSQMSHVVDGSAALWTGMGSDVLRERPSKPKRRAAATPAPHETATLYLANRNSCLAPSHPCCR